MKSFLFIIFVLISSFLCGQNGHLSFGIKENGICIGNSINYNGLRLNLWDKNANRINGLNISGYTEHNKSNGISIGILVSGDSVSNGIEIGGFAIKSKKHNGLALAVFGLNGTKLNGVGIGGLHAYADTLNGLFAGAFSVSAKSSEDSLGIINGVAVGGGVLTSKINGVSIGILANISDIQTGISIGAVNLTKELHGVQFGLINFAFNNRRFRWTPFLNFNFRKRSDKLVNYQAGS